MSPGIGSPAVAKNVATRSGAFGVCRHTLPAGTLPGIDTTIGLDLTKGDYSLYRRLLAIFFRTAQDFVVRFRAARASGDVDAAMRLAHDLKSMAATIGAQDVQRAGAALEQGCGELRDDASLEALLATAAQELAIVLNGLQALQEASTTGE